MEIILCFEKMLKISTVLAVADLFTFVNKSWNDPLNLLRFLKYWTQMKGLTLSFHFCSCTFCFVQKHGLQIKIKIWFSEKIQLLQSALWRQSILNKKGPNIWVGQYWFLVFWFLTLGSKVMTKKFIFFFTRVSDLEISFLVITFDPSDKMVEILKFFSKHKMISKNRQYVWALKFLTYHINSWF